MTNEISEKKQKLNGRNLCVNAIVCIVSLLVFRFNFIALCLCYIATSIILDQINKRICKNMIKQANPITAAQTEIKLMKTFFRQKSKSLKH